MATFSATASNGVIRASAGELGAATAPPAPPHATCARSCR
jgi:hypothetical protein